MNSKDKEWLMDEETLFRDENVFTPHYVPADFMHRDSQIQELKLALKPGLRGLNPVNLLLHGPSGTGKTTTVKFIFSQVKEASSKLITVYINCEDFSTPYGIFAKIYEEIYNASAPSTGKPLEELKEKIFRELKKQNRSIVIALDELDRLFLEKCADKVLVDLLKAHSTYGYDRIGIIGIMIDDSFIAELDEKARSVFNPNRILFPQYGKSEIHDILSLRVKYGFYDGVVSKDVLENVTEKTLSSGDLRIGIDLLRRSALLAEKDASRKILPKHVDEAYGKLSQTRKEEAYDQVAGPDPQRVFRTTQQPKRNRGRT